MATAKQINEAFLTNKAKKDMEVEKATQKNILKINVENTDEIHKKICKIFQIYSSFDSQYFHLCNFKKIIYEINERKKKKESDLEASKKLNND